MLYWYSPAARFVAGHFADQIEDMNGKYSSTPRLRCSTPDPRFLLGLLQDQPAIFNTHHPGHFGLQCFSNRYSARLCCFALPACCCSSPTAPPLLFAVPLAAPPSAPPAARPAAVRLLLLLLHEQQEEQSSRREQQEHEEQEEQEQEEGQ